LKRIRLALVYCPTIFISVRFDPDHSSKIPKHVAIIMDGNGRWAKSRGLPRIEGHRKGADAVKRALEAANECGVSYLTLYAFSVENWNRPKAEVDALMNLLDQFLKSQLSHLKKHKIRLKVIGRIHELPTKVQERLKKSIEATKDFTKCTLALALNYGARTETVDAVKSMLQAASEGKLDPNAVDYETLAKHLYTSDLPDPDLIIRTSGESRLSNFLLLQAAYAEIHFCKVLWPDFGADDFKAALADYASRERRYGKTGDQLQAK